MKPKYSPILRNLTWGALLIAWSQLGAAALIWDGNGTTAPNPNGGGGTWDTNNSTTWWDGATNVVWPAPGGADDDAVFANTAGTVTIAGAGGVTANDLTFITSGYVLNGTGLNFTGTDSKVTNDAGITATINAPISGTVTKAGTGNLYIGILNAGATLITTAGTTYANAGDGIRGTVQIDAGSTFRNTTAHVFKRPESRIWINGGTLAHGPASYPEYYVPAGASPADPGVQMTGGLWDTGQNRFDSGSTAHIRINAAETTATIAGQVLTYQNGTQVYNVVGGSVPTGIDLLFSGQMAGNFNANGPTHVTKTGAGLMEVTGTPVLQNNGILTLSQGTLRLTGTTAVTNFGTASSSLVLDATNPVVVQLNAVNAADSLTFSKNLTGGSAAATVAKIGAGTVTLSGAKTYAGTTAVTEGTLNLSGSLGDTNVVVAPGATLAGEGSIGTNGSLTFGEGAALRIDGGTATALTVGATATGNVTLTGTTNVRLDNVPPTIGATTYRVLNYFGTLTGAANFAAPGYRATFDTATPNQVNLTIGTYGLTWTGAAGGTWDAGTTASWAGADSVFFDGDSVTFGDGPALRDITLDATVRPAAMTFTNTAGNDYSLTGAGTIAGGAALTKSGDGKVTLATANTYTGATTISAGTLQLGNADANGTLAGASAITTDGSLVIFNSNGDLAQGTHFSGAAISGSGSLTKAGTSQLTLSAANTFAGGTTVSQGTLRLTNAGGAGTGSITLGDADTAENNVALSSSVSLATPITVSPAGEGMASIGQTTNYTALTGLLTLNRATTLNTTAGDRAGVDGKITGNPGTLTFTGNRVTLGQTLANASDFTGNVIVACQVQLNSLYALPATASVTVNGGAWFRTIAGATIDALNGTGTITNNSGGGAATTPLLIGNNNGDGSFSGTLQNGSGADIVSLVKNGTGTQELGGANIKYTGATTLNDGTLVLTGTAAFNSAIAMSDTNPVTLKFDGTADWTLLKSLTGGASAAARIEKAGTGVVTLAGPGTTFAGTAADALKVTEGTLYVDVALAASPAVVSGGMIGGKGSLGDTWIQAGGAIEGGHAGAGALTVSNLTIGSGAADTATVKGTLAAGTTPIVTQNLTLNGGNGSVLLNATGTGLTDGSYYDVIGYSGTLSAPNAGSPQTVFTTNSRAYYPYVNMVAKKVQLYYDANASIYWTGLGSTEWSNTAGLNNWKLNGTDGVTNFLTNDVVIFDNRATSTTVEITEDVAPIGTTFDNDADHPYTLAGSFGIVAGSLTKKGAGSLTVSSFNTYPGGTTLTAGVLEVAGSDALGSSGVISMNGGTLRYSDFNSTDYSARLRLEDGKAAGVDTNGRTVTFAAPLATGGAGTGALVKTGPGTLVLTVNNTYTGGSTISAGTLRLDGGFNGYCAGTGPLTLGDANTPAEGASLGVFGANWGTGPDRWVANDITVAATGAGSGPLMIFRPTGVYAATLRGTITLANNVILRNTTGDRLAIEGRITGAGNVTIEGNRINIDNATNDYLGATTIAAGGILQLNNNNVIPATSEVTVNGQLSFQSDAATALTIKALNGNGVVNIPWGSGNPVLTVGANDGSGSFAGAITSRLAVTKTGTGTQLLTGPGNDYSGATLVEGGTLQIDGAKTGAGNVTVTAAATLAGTGSVSGATTVEAGGLVAPGNAAIGTLTLAAATIGGTYQCQLDAATCDLLAVTGTLTVDAGTSITFSGTPAASEYTIVTYGTLGGALPTIVPPSGYALDIATAGQIKLIKTASGYSAWADSFAGLTDKTPGGDPDGDGIKNVVEYVIGGDPRVSSTGFLPKASLSGGHLVLRYQRNDNSEADTTQTGQWSANLSGWTDLAPVLVNENGAAPDDMEIRIPLTHAVNGKLAGRLHITQAP
jgi:autotransporter-associated beta strand protein